MPHSQGPPPWAETAVRTGSAAFGGGRRGQGREGSKKNKTKRSGGTTAAVEEQSSQARIYRMSAAREGRAMKPGCVDIPHCYAQKNKFPTTLHYVGNCTFQLSFVMRSLWITKGPVVSVSG